MSNVLEEAVATIEEAASADQSHQSSAPTLVDRGGLSPSDQPQRGLLRTIYDRCSRTVTLCTRKLVEKVLLRRQAERFYLVFGGHLFFQTLRAAAQFDLFTLLDREGALTRAQIAEKLGIQEQPARILLLGLTSCRFLKKRGSQYSITKLSRELLSRDSRNNVLAYIELQHQGMYKAMPHLYESILKYENVGLCEFSGDEPTFYERLAHTPDLQKIFQDAMSELSVQTNELLARFIDLSDVSHLVDVGGGDGTNILTLSQRFPHLRATVFDLPSVCEIARTNIADHARSDRLDVVAGHCFRDDFPADADCFLFCHFFTIWSPEKDRLLLKKCYDALPTGGRVMIFNMMQHDDETGPLSAAVGSPYFLTLATGEGMLYTWAEYESWMREAGFSGVERHVLPRDHGIIVGVKR